MLSVSLQDLESVHKTCNPALKLFLIGNMPIPIAGQKRHRWGWFPGLGVKGEPGEEEVAGGRSPWVR